MALPMRLEKYQIDNLLDTQGVSYIYKWVSSMENEDDGNWGRCLVVIPDNKANRWCFITIDFEPQIADSPERMVLEEPGFQGKHPFRAFIKADSFEEAYLKFFKKYNISNYSVFSESE